MFLMFLTLCTASSMVMALLLGVSVCSCGCILTWKGACRRWAHLAPAWG